jgi:hypothetical protein
MLFARVGCAPNLYRARAARTPRHRAPATNSPERAIFFMNWHGLRSISSRNRESNTAKQIATTQG